ncbi:hypothetical protein PRIC1_012690 [Phytophthora ramorum]
MSLLHDDGEDFEALDAALSFVDAYIASPAAVVQDGVSSSDDAMLGDDLDELLRTTLSPSTSSSSGGEFTHEIDTTSRRQLMLPSPLAPLAANMTAPDVAKVKENGRFQGGCRKSHCQAATNAAVATKRVKVNPNRARNERKNELAYLRNKVTQMETELGELHTRHHMGGTALTVGIDYFVSPSGPKESGLALTVANSAPDIPPFWRDMATRQKLRRDKAERENARLKLVLEGQVKLARNFRVKQVLRRYVEADRQVVVWVTSVHSLDEGKSRPFAGLGFAEKGYVVIKRPKSPALVKSGFTVLQMCSLVVPQKAESCAQDATTVGAFTEFALNVIVANATVSQERIENVLLDQALKEPPPP